MKAFLMGMMGALGIAMAAFLGMAWQRQQVVAPIVVQPMGISVLTTSPEPVNLAPWTVPPTPPKPSLEFYETKLNTFIFDRTDGTVYRYYRNVDSKGTPTAEGFQQLSYLPLPSPPPPP